MYSQFCCAFSKLREQQNHVYIIWAILHKSLVGFSTDFWQLFWRTHSNFRLFPDISLNKSQDLLTFQVLNKLSGSRHAPCERMGEFRINAAISTVYMLSGKNIINRVNTWLHILPFRKERNWVLRIIRSFWTLTGDSLPLLLRRLSNVKDI